jgi:hypothetical protein
MNRPLLNHETNQQRQRLICSPDRSPEALRQARDRATERVGQKRVGGFDVLELGEEEHGMLVQFIRLT